MRLIRSAVTLVLVVVALGAHAQATTNADPADGVILPLEEQPALEDLLWVARPVVIFADTPNDPRFAQQIEMFTERSEDLADRDVVFLTDTDPAAKGPLRLALRPRGFGVVVIDKDGTIAKRLPTLTRSRELISLIDRMPSRRLETGSMRQ